MMKDSYGREINYLRISVTDRCNLRCRYCMPLEKTEGTGPVLSFEELLTVVRAVLPMGITRFKITGGEPLVRQGTVDFLSELKRIPGVERVTLTTNGLLLHRDLEKLRSIGIDGINISLDTLNEQQYRRLTGIPEGKGGVSAVLDAVRASVSFGISTRLNAVLLEETKDQILKLASLAEDLPLSVRLIEQMPLGPAAFERSFSPKKALALLREQYPDLSPVSREAIFEEGRRKSPYGNGPAEYYASESLKGFIGMIRAVEEPFCESCNRLRLTSGGQLKACLCYDIGIDLLPILRSGKAEGVLEKEIREAFRSAIWKKPWENCFQRADDVTEKRTMNEIGG